MLLRFQLLLLCTFFTHFSNAYSSDIVRINIGRFSDLNIRGTDLILQNKLGATNTDLSLKCTEAAGIAKIQLSTGEEFPAALVIHSRGGFIFVNAKPYRGQLSVYAQNNECLVVNHLSIEKYISGLLNKEMIPSWPLEALKAQAVASRTYALFQRAQNRGRLYDLENTTQDQVYDGAGTESTKSSIAAQSTAGMVLTWKHSPVKAFYHANCGGRTESPEAVWGFKYGYFKPVVCPYHSNPQDQKHWSLQLSVNALEQSLRKISGLLPQRFIRVASVEPGALNESSRLKSVIVSDAKGNSTQISANAFRNAVGNGKIKSTAFEIKRSGAALSFEGKGNGHGVGLCQVGAKVMATKGKTFRDILKYYYPLAKLERLK